MTSYCGLLAVQHSSAFGPCDTSWPHKASDPRSTPAASQLLAAGQCVMLHPAATDVSVLSAFVVCCVASLQTIM